MSYCMYLRKSRADRDAEARGQGETLARHRAALLELAARRGDTIAQEYREIVSGETISDRPEMRRLLADVMAGRWAGVYVVEVERLARGDTKDQGVVANAFKYTGTRIITPGRVYNPDDPTDEEYFEFGLFMSRREYKTINRRQQAGRLRSITEGKYISCKPAYGYRRKKLPGKGWSLAIEPDEAAVVRRIFRLYADGMGLAAICRRLNGEGIPSGTGGALWMPKRVAGMLENEIYTGMIRWGRNPIRRTLENGEIVKRRILSSEYKLVPGLHPAIVPPDLWAAAQAARAGRKRLPVPVDHAIANPLAGLLVCAECGRRLVMKPPHGGQPASVHCNAPGCPTVSSYLSYVEAAVRSTLKSWLDDYRLPARFAAARPERDAEAAAAQAAVRRELDKLRKQLSRVQTLLETDVYTVEEYMSRSAAVKAGIENAESRLAQLEPVADTAYGTIEQIAPVVKTLLNLYDSLTPERKNILLRVAVSKIIYSKSKKGGRYSRPDQFTLDVYPGIFAESPQT